ncbi:hypothetical protein MSPP1_003657 [Malassezia sp. CBS 17886]|nr:hypothetical protein MSPP1_003657 [Malassezia sp. CBS 17886]
MESKDIDTGGAPAGALAVDGRRGVWAATRRWMYTYLNFFRLHLLYFVVLTMFASGIMYASSPKDHHVPYIDCLFMSASAMTMTGLNTVVLSQLTLWQQIIVFLLMISGNVLLVSLSMVAIRRAAFRAEFAHILQHSATARKFLQDMEENAEREPKGTHRWFGHAHDDRDPDARPRGGRVPKPKLNAAMVRRTDEPARQVNPTGQMTTMVHAPLTEEPDEVEPGAGDVQQTGGAAAERSGHAATPDAADAAAPDDAHEPRLHSILVPHKDTAKAERRHSLDHPARDAAARKLRNVHTVAFTDDNRHDADARAGARGIPDRARTLSIDARSARSDGGTLRLPGPKEGLHRTMTRNLDKGFGGFPTPFDFARSLLDLGQFRHHVTMPYTSTIASTHPDREGTRESADHTAPYLTFDATVTGNSKFHGLTQAQREELRGVEYRALGMLMWLIPLYWFTWVGVWILFTAPYLASRAGAQYRAVLADQPVPPRNSTWYCIFNVVSAMTNLGMSLADSSMSEDLRNAYMLLFPMMVLIIVGNTGFPVFLRATIWCLARVARPSSALYESCHFLMDHPRRCYAYLFPWGNTLFLVGMLLFFTIADWFFLIVLDLSRKTHPAGAWIVDALFQSIATRTAGFQALSIADLAPAMQMYQLLMLYFSTYPLTMSVRTTNVYEEKSLGEYEHDVDPDASNAAERRRAIWGRFLGRHIANQLAFDLWWLILAVWIICIAEQTKIENHDKYAYITVFSIMYEVVSGYGTVGLSIGSLVRNTAQAGDYTVISKLVMISVMMRGRHRGLPVALDRAVVLPAKCVQYDDFLGGKSPNAVQNAFPDRADAVEPHRKAPQPPSSSVQPNPSAAGLHRVPHAAPTPPPERAPVSNTEPTSAAPPPARRGSDPGATARQHSGEGRTRAGSDTDAKTEVRLHLPSGDDAQSDVRLPGEESDSSAEQLPGSHKQDSAC